MEKVVTESQGIMYYSLYKVKLAFNEDSVSSQFSHDSVINRWTKQNSSFNINYVIDSISWEYQRNKTQLSISVLSSITVACNLMKPSKILGATVHNQPIDQSFEQSSSQAINLLIN